MNEYIILYGLLITVVMFSYIAFEVTGLLDKIRRWWRGEGAFLPKDKEEDE